MELLRVDPANPDPEKLKLAAEALRRGELVAFPTETVYGLGAHALDVEAVARIYEAKGRPSYNPLIVHVADIDGARALASRWPDVAQRLATAFWPGPMTLVLPKRDIVPDEITAGLPSVGIRVPAHPVALALLRTGGLPVAAPSANRYTRISPTTAAHVLESLGDAVPIILDGGPTTVGIESTVVDLTGERPRILRPGMLDATAIARVAGPLDETPLPVAEGVARASPGMGDRHYAPRAHVLLFDGASRARALDQATAAVAQGQRVGALAFAALPALDTRVMPRDAGAYARALYAELHALDERGCALILVERVPDAPEWDGVRDRLERAAR
ncbi:MAG TPA: L-threonylcarbamoyladenylate synthase [Gemmatimonadaceae bacterium]|nr:L-threonylcarbamoyladenylate synthase [Gemmatimonadaceae bacterium]